MSKIGSRICIERDYGARIIAQGARSVAPRAPILLTLTPSLQ
jgi:hypothetical protein